MALKLRLIHAQTVTGPLLINDIDDGMPNKQVNRLTGDPKAYPRDGYANKTKQACYVPYANATTGTAGYLDLKLSDEVVLSKFKGTIAKMATAGLLTAVSFNDATDISAPTLSLADLGTPGAGQITLTGTNFTSLAPNITSVILTGTGAVTLTQTQITGAGGTVTATSIVIPAALVPGVANTTTSAQVKADTLLSAVVALS